MDIMNVEYSLGPFCNWFLPSCLDLWSSSDGQQVLCSYGARSMLCLLTITNNKTIKTSDCLSVFDDNKCLISCVKFAKRGRIFGQRPHLFISSSDGEAAVMDCNTRKFIYQTQDMNDLEIPSKKILSADWSHVDQNPVVYYSLHSVLIVWNIKTNVINKLLTDGENYQNRIGISCIASSNCGTEKVAVG